MMWPLCKFRMQVWNVLHAACWKCRTQKIAIKHHRTTLLGYIFTTEARVDNQKNLLSSRWGRLNAGAVAANWRLSMRSIVNLIRWQVYYTECPPYLFVARSPWCSALHRFVSNSWFLFRYGSCPPSWLCLTRLDHPQFVGLMESMQ